jgi:prepilin-type N-terminal cleavage/methylation domain-containing protein
MTIIKKYSVEPPCKNSVQGFSMLELSIVLVIAAIMASVGITTYRAAENNKINYIAQVRVEEANNALLDYIKKNNRLPCPDNDKDNFEDIDDTTGSCDPSAQVGFLPYATLKMTNEQIIGKDENRMIYGVYRGSKADEDLTSRQDLNMSTFMDKLRKIYKQKGDTNYPFRPNIGKLGLGNICSESLGQNPAYIIYAKSEASDETPMSKYKNCFYTDKKQFIGIVKYVYSADILGASILKRP